MNEQPTEAPKKSEIFPHVADYDSDPIIAERRKLLLKVISMLNEVWGGYG